MGRVMMGPVLFAPRASPQSSVRRRLEEALPVGSMLIGRPQADRHLLAMAAAVEAALAPEG